MKIELDSKELEQLRGQWVAFDSDNWMIAHAPTLMELLAEVRKHDMRTLLLIKIPLDTDV